MSQVVSQYNRNMDNAKAGLMADVTGPRQVRAFSNGRTQANQWTVTVTAADAEYSLPITLPNGEIVTAVYDEGAEGTTAAKVAGLVAAINDNLTLSPWLVALAKDADEFYVTSRDPGAANDIELDDTDSKITATESTLSSTGADLPFGRAVEFLDDAGKSCNLPSGSGGTFAGVALRSHDTVNNGTNLGYPAQESVPVMRNGRVWVEVDEAVVAGDAASYRHTATGSEKYGVFNKGTDSSDVNAITGAKFLTDAASGALALLDLG